MSIEVARPWIGGQSVETDRVDDILSPFDGSLVGRAHVADEALVRQAVSAAVDAFQVMRRLPTHQRAAILTRAADLLEAELEDFARRIALEAGKPISQARGEVKRGVGTLRLGAEEAKRLGGEVMPIDIDAGGENSLCYFQRIPRGAVVAICPFNFPVNLVLHKLSPAFAVGASVVLKPPPQCPLSAFALAALFDRAGLPKGALNVVHCEPEVAQRMVEDPRPKMFSFTGSARVGWHLKSVAGQKQVALELGGNAPCIVDEGVNVDSVVPPALVAAWAYAGQVCIRLQRVLVHSTQYDAFLHRFTDATRKVSVGDPLDEKTLVGPVIDASAKARILTWIKEAETAGAKVVTGGKASGNCVEPTILTDVPRDAKAYCEEVFGPVTVIERFEDFDQAIELCNDGRYGLQAGVFTPYLDRALRATRELEYGGVMVNRVPTFRMDNFPYGGSKDSGFGREGVRFAVEEMCELRTCTFHWDS